MEWTGGGHSPEPILLGHRWGLVAWPPLPGAAHLGTALKEQGLPGRSLCSPEAGASAGKPERGLREQVLEALVGGALAVLGREAWVGTSLEQQPCELLVPVLGRAVSAVKPPSPRP
jgi:hypothetical protein